MKAKLKKFERTRHLIAWLDNSTVANHGHLVGLITCLYDSSVFYTSQEFAVKTGRWVYIQSVEETPEFHFIVRCGGSNQDPLSYCETRLECVQQLKVPVAHNDIKYQDAMRLSHAGKSSVLSGHMKQGSKRVGTISAQFVVSAVTISMCWIMSLIASSGHFNRSSTWFLKVLGPKETLYKRKQNPLAICQGQKWSMT